MHFEALHCINLQSDGTENLTIAGMCKLIEHLLSSHKGMYFPQKIWNGLSPCLGLYQIISHCVFFFC